MRLDPAGKGPLSDETLDLAACYELCRSVEKAHSKTYYFSTSLFPAEIRPHVHALYAFMRFADEIVDNPKSTGLGEQLASLQAIEEETLAAVDGKPVSNPILRAFANTVLEHGLGSDLIKAFMKSMEMDTHVFRYPTYEDLEEYTYGSAAAVGLMMSRVVGAEDEAAVPHAEALGVAMQLTNFLRDVKEDWARGRVYLPLEDLNSFEYPEVNLGRSVMDERFIGLMRFEISRARALYRVADEGMRYIPRGRRYPVVVARRLYEAILERIEARGYDIFAGRVETSTAYKLRAAVRCAWGDPGEFAVRLRSSGSGGIAISP